jgi:undecaprenyl-diphosphatase
MKPLVATITHWDVVFFTRIAGLDGRKIISSAFPWISHSGNGYYYPAIPLILYLLNHKAAYPFFMASVAAFTLELPLYMILKNSIRRHRPCEVLSGVVQRVSPSDRFSFPSGHTAAACIIALMLSHFLPAIWVPAFVWAGLVGFSRIYLGVHYPTDILAGMVLGTACGWVGIVSIA